MDTQNQPEIQPETQAENLNEAQIPNYLRLNPIVAATAAAALLLTYFLDRGSGMYALATLVGFVAYLHFAFAIFAEQAFAYKNKGKINWKPIGIILGANILSVILWNPLDLCAFAAALYSERITESKTSKAILSFTKKAAAAATVALFAFMIFIAPSHPSAPASFADKSEIARSCQAQLNRGVMAQRQRIYETLHHPFGTCTSAQVRNFNIGWNGDAPETVSFTVELFWNTPMTPNGYTQIAVEEIYNYNTKTYEVSRFDVVRTNGKLSGDFWFDLGWGIGALLSM